MRYRRTRLRTIIITLHRSVVWAVAIRLFHCISTRMCRLMVQRWQDLLRHCCFLPSKCVTISNGNSNWWNSNGRDRSNSSSSGRC
uniref:Putative secreted protein n=1 Tax=Anopheles triannulatus TaxID=58253 RepID=A0A2M4B5R1_9DIPT